MAPDDIRSLLRKHPFEPFRLHMSNGMSADIRHPDLLAVADESMAIAVFNPNKSKFEMHHYSVINVNVIEPIPADEREAATDKGESTPPDE